MKALLFSLSFLAATLGGPCAAFEVTDNIVQQDKDLFAAIFQGKQVDMRGRWNAEQRALYSSGFSRNEAGRGIYIESIRLLSMDGTRLTTIRRQIFTDQLNASFLYNKTEEQAVLPFVFATPLRYIVDRKDERIDFQIWKMDAENKQLLGIGHKSYNLDTMKQVGASWNPVR